MPKTKTLPEWQAERVNLRAEAEEVARNILRDHASIATALINFATRHGERARLEGQIFEALYWTGLHDAYDERVQDRVQDLRDALSRQR
jgi:hypothetical protein